MKDQIQYSQVIKCENESEVNLLLDNGWIILETVSVTYDDGLGDFRVLMGNPGQKIEENKLNEGLGRKRTGIDFYDKKE